MKPLYTKKNGTVNKMAAIEVTMPASYLASNVTYDNSQSGLSATRVQGAIDELKNTKMPIARFLNTTAEVNSFLNDIIASSPLTYRIAVIVNTAKNDVFTSMSDCTSGMLFVYESDSAWADHPSFMFIDGYNYIWVGNLALSGGVWTVNSSRKI